MRQLSLSTEEAELLLDAIDTRMHTQNDPDLYVSLSHLWVKLLKFIGEEIVGVGIVDKGYTPNNIEYDPLGEVPYPDV